MDHIFHFFNTDGFFSPELEKTDIAGINQFITHHIVILAVKLAKQHIMSVIEFSLGHPSETSDTLDQVLLKFDLIQSPASV